MSPATPRHAPPLSRRLRVRLTLLAVAAFLIASTATAQTRIAVVDLQGAMMQTEDGMRAAAQLKNYTQSRQSELDRRQERLQQEQDELRRQARVLSRKAIALRTEHWQRRMVEVQTKFIEYNKQLQKHQAGLMNPLVRKMFRVIKRVASKRGFDMVIDRAAVPFARADLDLTDAVVQRYNGGGGGGDDDGDEKNKEEPKKEEPKTDTEPGGAP